MGFLRLNPWKDEKGKTTHHDAFLWGEVVSTPKVRTDLKKRYVEVLVKYKKHPKEMVICKRWSDYKADLGEKALDPTNRAVENLRKHDTVLIVGRYDETPYVNREGVEKMAYAMRIEFIIPQDTVAGLAELMSSVSVQNLMKLDAKYADRMEVTTVDEDDEEEYEDYGEYEDIGF